MELGELGEPVPDSVGEAQARRVFAISLMSRTACMLAVAACFGAIWSRMLGSFALPVVVVLGLAAGFVLTWWETRRLARFESRVEELAPGALASEGLTPGRGLSRPFKVAAYESLLGDSRVSADAGLVQCGREVVALLRAQRLGYVPIGVSVIVVLGLLMWVPR